MSIGEIVEISIEVLKLLPYQSILIGVVVGWVISSIWYGFFFRKQFVRLINKSEGCKPDAWLMIIQLIGLALLSYLIGILSLHPDIYWVAIDALIGVVVFMTFTGMLMQRGTTKTSFQLGGIVAGHDAIVILAIALVMVL